MILLKRALLWLLTVAIPVVIAACYGMVARYSKSGQVIDGETGAGIDGIEVTCMHGDAAWNTSMTYSGGQFVLDYDEPCDEVRLKDVDGAQNGAYLSKTVPFCAGCETLEYTMERDK